MVVGTAKNVGKTTTLAALRAVAERRGVPYAVTSIGRDGESFDAVDGLPKPRVHLPAGTLVALPETLVAPGAPLEVLERGVPGALGTTLIARVRAPATCEVGGPPQAAAMRALITRLAELTAGPVFVDGAIDRVAALAGGDDAVIVATGAASGAAIPEVAAEAADLVARLTVPGRDPARERDLVRVAGALDARAAQTLRRDAAGATVVVDDPTRIVVRGAAFAALRAAVDLRCERPLRVVACTTSPARGDAPLAAQALADAVAGATGLPVFDVVAGVSAR